MKLSEIKELVAGYNKYERLDLRLEVESGADLETALSRVNSGETQVYVLGKHWSDEAAMTEMGYQLAESLDIAQNDDIVSRYFNYASFGHDLFLSGDYSLIKYKGEYFAVGTH